MVQSLAHIDPGKAGFLVGFLSNENALVRQTVAQVLGEGRITAAEDALIMLLQDENGHVRSTAAGALGLLQSRSNERPATGSPAGRIRERPGSCYPGACYDRR